jgi:calcium permeable stress-gated cation channel
LIFPGAGNVHGSVSLSNGRLIVFKAMFFILAAIACTGLIVVGALIFAIEAFGTGNQPPAEVANGAIYISALVLSIIVTVAIISPALLMLQPFRLWHILRAEKHAITPRQRFRGIVTSILRFYYIDFFVAIYPRSYNPSFATGACILAIIFASTFCLIFPLVGPAVVILLFLTLIGELCICNREETYLNLGHSASISHWLCICSNPLANRRPLTDLVIAATWNTSLVTTSSSWFDPFQQRVLD